MTGSLSASFGDAWPMYGPWLFAVSVVTVALFVARWLWPVLVLSVLVGLASATFWGWVVVAYGQLWFAVATLLSLIGALSAFVSSRHLRERVSGAG
jgi:hypothetical protein